MAPLLLSWILGLVAVPLVLLTCKKKAKTTTEATKSTTMETAVGRKSAPISKEVQEHNAKINAGMKRPQKDDETVDDQLTDWGAPQKMDQVEGDPASLKPDSLIGKGATGTKPDTKK